MDSVSDNQQFFGSVQGIDTINSNQGYNTALKIRLDTTSLLGDIQDFLRGTSTYQDLDKDGKQCMKTIVVGEPLANTKGVQAIMMKCVIFFNPHLVQGNYDDARYNLDRKMNREDWAIDICKNRGDWGIKEERMEHIVDTIMNLIKKFESRTLYNKERESYNQTVQSKETHQILPENGQKSRWGF